MSAADLAAVLIAVVALAAVAALAVVCVRLTSLNRRLGDAVEELREEAERLRTETAGVADAAGRAAHQVDRLEDLIRTGGSIAGTVDTATQATLRALSNPVIKGAALASGTRGAARRLRGKERA